MEPRRSDPDCAGNEPPILAWEERRFRRRIWEDEFCKWCFAPEVCRSVTPEWMLRGNLRSAFANLMKLGADGDLY
jgi:hypothetical protein